MVKRKRAGADKPQRKEKILISKRIKIGYDWQAFKKPTGDVYGIDYKTI